MCLKGFVTAAFGSCDPFYLENGRVLSAPSLHRESTDSLTSKQHFAVLYIEDWDIHPMIH